MVNTQTKLDAEFTTKDYILVKYNNERKRKVVIPSGVKTIGKKAFYQHKCLQTAIIADDVVTISGFAFSECKNLKRIEISGGVKRIGEHCFAKSEKLYSVTIPDSVVSIREYAFYSCMGLTEIVIPQNVETVRECVFKDCRGLQTIIFTGNLSEIKWCAFYNCESLKEISLPDAISAIHYGTFYGCRSLEQITIPSSVTFIEKDAFLGCSNLESVMIENEDIKIEEDAFRNCFHLNKQSLKSIARHTIQPDFIDISSKVSGIAGRLSNFTGRQFVFDGCECNSIEGVLQSLKFNDIERQKEICAMVGSAAKNIGSGQDWRSSQTLYWKNVAYKRDDGDYQKLLDRLYSSVFEQDEQFREDLYNSGNSKLTHRMGRGNIKETILTEQEFCERLMQLRENIIS